MLHIEPKDVTVPEVHRLLLGGVGPRPIALVSTISREGILNLTPFSFFNAFGSNPPIIAFSPSRRGRNATLKDTYYNLMDNGECVVQSVTYPMVEQISLASTEYTPEVNEFMKSGLTPVDSDLVKPKRVKESPFQMECKLREMRSFGEGGSSANIAICEVIKFHVAEDIFREGIIHPDLIDLVARMSANYYCRASGDSIFEVEKPILKRGIGYDMLPDFMKNSDVYSGNNLGKFGNIEQLPSEKEVDEFIAGYEEKDLHSFEPTLEAFYRYQRHKDPEKMIKAALELKKQNYKKIRILFELTAKCALEINDIPFAWKTALYAGRMK
ncbi:MAG TPA: flavin reductase family protein [Ignavibacteriaceae bacterium]|nr:flavin reductase family protein [Ignavibacteriaceae bacterium]